MNDESMTQIVVRIPMKIFFELRERAGDLTVKQYVELLLRSVDRLSEQADKKRIKEQELEAEIKRLKDFINGCLSEDDEDTIEDGFGSAWSAWCPKCGLRTMCVVRPGKVQCNYCG